MISAETLGHNFFAINYFSCTTRGLPLRFWSSCFHSFIHQQLADLLPLWNHHPQHIAIHQTHDGRQKILLTLVFVRMDEISTFVLPSTGTLGNWNVDKKFAHPGYSLDNFACENITHVLIIRHVEDYVSFWREHGSQPVAASLLSYATTWPCYIRIFEIFNFYISPPKGTSFFLQHIGVKQSLQNGI